MSDKRSTAVLLMLAAGTLGAGPATRPATKPADPAPVAADRDIPKPPAGDAAVRLPPLPPAPLPPVGALRQQPHEEYSAAVDARDAADRRRAAYEKSHRPGRAKNPDDQARQDDDFAEVVTLYRQAINRFPATEIECDLRIRLAGAYQYRGQFDLALQEAKQAAERFAGTPPGLSATHTVGLIYLQAMHDKRQAEVWFQRLRAEAGAIKDDELRLKWDVAATQGLARCRAGN